MKIVGLPEKEGSDNHLQLQLRILIEQTPPGCQSKPISTTTSSYH